MAFKSLKNSTVSGFARDIDYKQRPSETKKYKLRYMHANCHGIDLKNPSDAPIRFQGLVPPQALALGDALTSQAGFNFLGKTLLKLDHLQRGSSYNVSNGVIKKLEHTKFSPDYTSSDFHLPSSSLQIDFKSSVYPSVLFFKGSLKDLIETHITGVGSSEAKHEMKQGCLSSNISEDLFCALIERAPLPNESGSRYFFISDQIDRILKGHWNDWLYFCSAKSVDGLYTTNGEALVGNDALDLSETLELDHDQEFGDLCWVATCAVMMGLKVIEYANTSQVINAGGVKKVKNKKRKKSKGGKAQRPVSLIQEVVLPKKVIKRKSNKTANPNKSTKHKRAFRGRIGTFRTLRNARFVNKRGERIWVDPIMGENGEYPRIIGNIRSPRK